MSALILKLDVAGQPAGWVSRHKGALLYCRGQVAWEAEEGAVRLYGAADSGIMDPDANSLERIDSIDRTSVGYTHASTMLLGGDRYCRAYLKAYCKKLY